MTGLPPADRTGTGNMVSVRDANLIMLITFALYMAYEFLLRYMPFLNDRTVPRIITGQILLVLPGLIYLIAGHIRIRNFMEIKEPSGFSLKMAFCALICAYPVVIILNLFSMRHVVNRVIDILPDVLKLGLLPSMLILALLPACVEEFLFRGIMYHSYRQVSRRGGIVLSALLFGLMHLNLNQMPYAFFLGLVLASMVEATGSIETSIFMHFLFNLNRKILLEI